MYKIPFFLAAISLVGCASYPRKKSSEKKIKKYKFRTLCFATLFLFTSCTSIKTDPYSSFLQVKDDVAHRTNQIIQWNNQVSDLNCTRDFIERTLDHQLSVDDVVKITLLNNRHLQALYEKLGIAQAELVQASLFKNPILDFQLRYDNGFGSDKIIEAGIIQNLLDILLRPLKKRVARAELEIIKNQVTGDVMEIIAEAKIAFFTLQDSEMTLSLRKKVQDATEAAFDAAKRLRKAGNINNLKLAIERSFYEQSKIDVSQSELKVVEAREKLNVLMGLWGLQVEWELSSQLIELPNKLPDFKEIENDVVANNLDLQVARKQIYLTAARVGINTAEVVFPDLGIGVDSEREIDGNWFVGPQLTIGIPIFDFGQARTAAGRAELNQLCNEYYALAVELRSSARSASFRLWNSYRQNRYFEEVLIPLAEEVTAETLLQHNAMQLGVFDILSAKQREIETREKAIHTYRDYWIAHTELELLKNGRMKHKTRMD